MVHITGTRMIDSGIYGLSRGKKLGGMMRGVKPLKPVPVDVGAVEILRGLEECLRSWWGANIKKIQPSYWFEVKEDILLLETTPDVAETVIKLFLEACLQHPYRYHLIVVHLLMEFLWRKRIGKETYLLFNVNVGIPFWYLRGHVTLIIVLLLPIISLRKWRGPWTIKGSDKYTVVLQLLGGSFSQHQYKSMLIMLVQEAHSWTYDSTLTI